MTSTKALATAFTAVALLASCESGEPSTPVTCAPEGSSVQVVASGGQFDTDCLAVPADQPFTVTFTNEDPSHHNFTVRDGDETVLAIAAGTDESSKEEGPAMKAGTYEFLCTIHPVMEGTFIVG